MAGGCCRYCCILLLLVFVAAGEGKGSKGRDGEARENTVTLFQGWEVHKGRECIVAGEG